MSCSTEILPGQEKEKCDRWELNEEPVNGSSTLPRPNVLKGLWSVDLIEFWFFVFLD